jgi:Flp pilus assembly protein CpaB
MKHDQRSVLTADEACSSSDILPRMRVFSHVLRARKRHAKCGDVSRRHRLQITNDKRTAVRSAARVYAPAVLEVQSAPDERGRDHGTSGA